MFTSGQCGVLFGIVGIFLLSSPKIVVKCDENSDTWNVTAADRLRASLFTNYDKFSHPMVSDTEKSNVTIGITVQHIDIDELNGKMTMHGWVNLGWKDRGRTWKPAYFENVSTVHMRAREVWKPELTLFNSAGSEDNYVGDTPVILSPDGSFLWVPPVLYKAYCHLNLEMWPYDTQICKLNIGTWSMTTLIIYHSSGALDTSDYVESSEWMVIETKEEFKTTDLYTYLECTFILQRRSSMYSAVIFTPASCIILLCLSTFWLPPHMGEKILLNCIVIVIVAAFLMYFAQILPILAENTPLIVLFYSTTLLLLSLSTIIAVLVLYLSTAKHKTRSPEFLKRLLNGNLGKYLLLSQFTLEAEPQNLLNNGIGSGKELTDHIYDNPEPLDSQTDATAINPSQSHSRSVQFDWIILATAIDRLSFLIYCVLFIILAIIYSV